jgi:hypothetical protein
MTNIAKQKKTISRKVPGKIYKVLFKQKFFGKAFFTFQHGFLLMLNTKLHPLFQVSNCTGKSKFDDFRYLQKVAFFPFFTFPLQLR